MSLADVNRAHLPVSETEEARSKKIEEGTLEFIGCLLISYFLPLTSYFLLFYRSLWLAKIPE
jgi:hypothetical protein